MMAKGHTGDTELLPRVPPDRAEHYRQQGWWQQERVDELVLRHSIALAGKSAVVAGDRGLTYGELAAAVHRATGRLRQLGLGQNDNVVVQLPNDLELVVLVLALIRLGARPILTLPALRRYELDHIVSAARPVAMAIPKRLRGFDHLDLARDLRERHSSLQLLLVVDHNGPDEVDLSRVCRPDGADVEDGANVERERAHAPAGPEDVALFLLSSGTTGPPKLIPRTHADYGCVIRTSAEISGLCEKSVYLALMPATHSFVFGHPGMLGALTSGGRVVFGTHDDPARAFALIERERVTHCALVPALVTQWLARAAKKRTHKLTSLQVLQVGGAKLTSAAAADVQRILGCRVQQVYGMSEGLLNFTRLDDPDEVCFETQGRPASPGDDTRIVSETGDPVAYGEVGELLTRGPYTIAGYYGDPEANARSFTSDGFYCTGDLVRLHPSGNFVVEGRTKDVINRGGEKISADELEALALQHPSISNAAAVAMPHPRYGEAVCLFVVLRGGEKLELRDVRLFLESRGLARFKLPRRLVAIESLPTIGIGKVNKVALRESAARLAAKEVGAV
jgi:2,3-dihydroxybenzoate---[aryl-carrier protein] ligase